MEEKIAQVELLNKTGRSFGERIKQVSINYMDKNQAATIANSEGLYVEDNRIHTRYYLNVVAEKDGILQTGYETPGGTGGFELFDYYPPEETARKCAQRRSWPGSFCTSAICECSSKTVPMIGIWQ